MRLECTGECNIRPYISLRNAWGYCIQDETLTNIQQRGSHGRMTLMQLKTNQVMS